MDTMDALLSALGFLGGFTGAANQLRGQQQQEQLRALQILGSQPGMQIVPAAPGTVGPSPFVQRLFGGAPLQRTGPGAPVLDLGGTAITAERMPVFAPDEIQDFPEFVGMPKSEANMRALTVLRQREQQRQEDFASQTMRDLRQTQQREAEREQEREFRRSERIGTSAETAQRAQEQRTFTASENEKQRAAALERVRLQHEARGIKPDEAVRQITRLRQAENSLLAGRGFSDREMLYAALAGSGSITPSTLRDLGVAESASPEAEAAKQRTLATIRAAIAYYAPYAPEAFQRGSGAVPGQPQAPQQPMVGGVPITGFRRVK